MGRQQIQLAAQGGIAAGEDRVQAFRAAIRPELVLYSRTMLSERLQPTLQKKQETFDDS
jgi:hypothetical protein